MKRKIQPKEDAIVPVEILDTSRTFFVKDRVRNTVSCSVCGSPTTDELIEKEAQEHLCWVCRRLKISAWRDSEPMPAQE
jgi:formylmethanofuran dehydrogenase subunit E